MKPAHTSRNARRLARRLPALKAFPFLWPKRQSGCAPRGLLCYEALSLKDRGEPHGWLSAGAKWLAPELSAQVLHQCLLLHGHWASVSICRISSGCAMVIGLEIGDGTAQIMKSLVAREIIGKVARPY